MLESIPDGVRNDRIGDDLGSAGRYHLIEQARRFPTRL